MKWNEIPSQEIPPPRPFESENRYTPVFWICMYMYMYVSIHGNAESTLDLGTVRELVEKVAAIVFHTGVVCELFYKWAVCGKSPRCFLRVKQFTFNGRVATVFGYSRAMRILFFFFFQYQYRYSFHEEIDKSYWLTIIFIVTRSLVYQSNVILK